MIFLLVVVILSFKSVLIGAAVTDVTTTMKPLVFHPYQTKFIVDPSKINCSAPDKIWLCDKITGPVPGCIDFELFEMTTNLKQRILAGHNGLRNLAAKRVGYEIANMNILHWDNDLGEVAKQQIYQCGNKIGSQTVRFINKTYDDLYFSNNTFYTQEFPGYKKWLSKAIHSWLNNSNNYLDSKGLTPYIQLIFPQTKFVGCAGARFNYGMQFICYYGPSVEENFYNYFKMGRWCSNCPPDRTTCSTVFESLCGLDLFAGSNRLQSNLCLLVFIVIKSLKSF